MPSLLLNFLLGQESRSLKKKVYLSTRLKNCFHLLRQMEVVKLYLVKLIKFR